MRRILLVSVVGTVVAMVRARGTSSPAVLEIKAYESWQGCSVDEG